MESRTLVLLGLGHTNAHVVHRWIKNPIENCRLVCISNFPHATYSGMLPGTLAGQFQEQEMLIDLPGLTRKANAELIVGEVQRVDLSRGQILIADQSPISFDALSVGVGSVPVGLEAVSESPLIVPVKPMQTFLSRIDKTFANLPKKHLRIGIVGGGVASIEIAMCLRQRLSQKHTERGHEITIITAGERIAAEMRPRSAQRIEQLLRSRGIRVLARSPVISVDDAEITLEDHSTHPFDCVLWVTGATAPKVLESIDVEKDPRGFIATTKTLQSCSDPRIFAVGDSGTIIQAPTPKAGVYAVRQSPILWHNLRAFFANQEPKHFEPQAGFLKLLNTGDGKALMEYGKLTVHARWCLTWKTWIDRRFIQKFMVSP